MPEIIDPVFAKTSQNARFLLSENERFGLVFVKTGSINSGTGLLHNCCRLFDFGFELGRYSYLNFDSSLLTMLVVADYAYHDTGTW